MKNNIRITLTALTVLLMTFFMSALFTTDSNAVDNGNKTGISFKEIKHDFGKVKQGEVLLHTFEFINAGENELVIISVNAGCGCTGVKTGDKKEYLKNEKGEIQVSLNTQGRSGIQSKSVVVKTNDPDMPEVILTISCEII